MKKSALTVCLILAGLAMLAQKVVFLSELNRPRGLAVDVDRFYVCEGANIYIFSLKNHKLVKNFGKKGEGPGEFLGNAHVTIQATGLLVNSLGKISFFDKNGRFLKEIKDKIGLNFTFLPVGDHFVALNRSFESGFRMRTITLLDKQLNKVKEIEKFKDFIQLGEKVNLLNQKGKTYRTMADNIIIDDVDGSFRVLNPQGKVLNTFRPKFKPLKLSEKIREQIKEYMKTNAQLRQNYQRFKHLLVFPEYFPPVQDFVAKDNLIYILTFRRNKGRAEFFVFNLQGKLKVHAFLPFYDRMPLFTQPYDIKNNILYQLTENRDEQWELHVNEIR